MIDLNRVRRIGLYGVGMALWLWTWMTLWALYENTPPSFEEGATRLAVYAVVFLLFAWAEDMWTHRRLRAKRTP